MQNLIPLVLFRPLRLFIAAEQLRSGRITLLKITHLPYIATIWAYESASEYFGSRHGTWRYSTRSQKHPQVGHRVQSRHRATRYPTHRNRSDGSLFVQTPISARRRSVAIEAESLVELRHAIEQLGTQVQELARQVTKPEEQLKDT